MAANKTKISFLRHHIAKWDKQIKSGEFTKAAPDTINRAQRASKHWDEQHQIRESILARRKKNTEEHAEVRKQAQVV